MSTPSPSRPVTVTERGAFQLAGVKVSELTETLPCSALELEIGMVTSAVGCDFRATVKVSVPPPSVVSSGVWART